MLVGAQHDWTAPFGRDTVPIPEGLIRDKVVRSVKGMANAL